MVRRRRDNSDSVQGEDPKVQTVNADNGVNSHVNTNRDVNIPVVTIRFPSGRPSKYDETIPRRVLELSKLGLTLEQMSMAIGCHLDKFTAWMREYPALREAYEQGKWLHDHGVQLSLLKRALGYTYQETSHFNGVDSLGRPYSYSKTVDKVVLPDVTAQIFWLKNRDRENWRDVHRTDVNFSTTVNMNKTMNLNLLSKKEREFVEGIAMKQIEGLNGISTSEPVAD